jgi:zinc transport system permease protein
MSSFMEALTNPAFPFLRNALIAGLLSSILFGILGSIVTVKRIAGLAGSISHAVLGGIGMALFLSGSGIILGFPAKLGALIFALLAALIIGFVSLKAKQREDTVINAVWAIGMSTGLIFLAKTPGYADPSAYLFGNILLVSTQDLVLLAIMAVLILLLVIVFYSALEASAFDEEFAQSRGINTQAVFIVLLLVVAVAVVLVQSFIGIVMVIAMLVLPPGSAGFFAKNLAGMMLWSTVLAMVYNVVGLFFSWIFDLPAGAVIVILAGFVFLQASLVKAIVKKRMS